MTAQPAARPAAPRTPPPVTTLPARRLLEAVARPVLTRGNHQDLSLDALLEAPLGRRLARKLALGERLRFLLPAFPAKSSNRDKTHSAQPDLGEVLALRNLQAMCEEITAAYAPGAQVVICSDGRVFNDLVMVSDADLASYTREISAILEREGLTHLSTFSLEDCQGILDPDHLREDLVESFGPSLGEIREAVRQSPERRQMWNGIHRFMKDDLGFHFPELSRNKVMKRAKALSYQVVQRSQSWDNFLETIFPEALRLSIHPYPVAHRKYGVQLVPAADRWATPWHNVTVRTAGGYRLMKRRQALALGAVPTVVDGRYVCYEVR